MNLLNIVIETERLRLKTISYDYIDEINMEYIPNVTKKLRRKSIINTDNSKKMIEESLERIRNGTILKMVIINKDLNEFIGLISLHEINTLEPFVEVWIKKASRKTGFGIEAMNGLLEWANKNIEFNYIYYSLRKKTFIKRKETKNAIEKTAKGYKILGI